MELTENQRVAFARLVDFAFAIDRLGRWAQSGLVTDAELRRDLIVLCETYGAEMQGALGAYAPPVSR
jgi:hypothetical protein